MWILALFDLPVKEKEQRRQATQFRKTLLREGFTMLQFSVYARPCPSEEAALAFRNGLRGALPQSGHVRIISITDRQFARMEVFLSQKSCDPERAPAQLELF
jgi:CRISPR-associated protein Cas2